MIKGIYTASSGMHASQRRLDIISNNLSNAKTKGYKKEGSIKESFPEMMIQKLEGGSREDIGQLGTGVQLEKSYTDFSMGGIKRTGNPLDLSIKGDGFFVVQTPSGRKYTRNGSFSLNQDGQMVTQQGYPVLSENDQPIQTIEGRRINIDGNGQVYLGDLQADRLQIVDFDDRENLIKTGKNLFENKGDQVAVQQADDFQLLQGYLEGSNVNVVQEMSKMIEVNRLYQAQQRVIKNADSTLDKAVNQVGRVG
jgi:flagellar basal-body rod protein FlgG